MITSMSFNLLAWLFIHCYCLPLSALGNLVQLIAQPILNNFAWMNTASACPYNCSDILRRWVYLSARYDYANYSYVPDLYTNAVARCGFNFVSDMEGATFNIYTPDVNDTGLKLDLALCFNFTAWFTVPAKNCWVNQSFSSCNFIAGADTQPCRSESRDCNLWQNITVFSETGTGDFITVRYQYVCTDQYYMGPRCSIYCYDDNQKYYCDNDGNKHCRDDDKRIPPDCSMASVSLSSTSQTPEVVPQSYETPKNLIIGVTVGGYGAYVAFASFLIAVVIALYRRIIARKKKNKSANGSDTSIGESLNLSGSIGDVESNAHSGHHSQLPKIPEHEALKDQLRTEDNSLIINNHRQELLDIFLTDEAGSKEWFYNHGYITKSNHRDLGFINPSERAPRLLDIVQLVANGFFAILDFLYESNFTVLYDRILVARRQGQTNADASGTADHTGADVEQCEQVTTSDEKF